MSRCVFTGDTMRCLLLGTTAMLAMGCYTAEPVVTATQPGQELVVQITDAGSAQLAHYVGPGVSVINGRFMNAAGDTLKMAVSSTETRAGDVHFWKGEEISLTKNLVATLSEKKLSPVRSVLATGVALAAAALLKVGFGGSSGSGRTTRPPVGQ
jgi:hypothetical protein